MSNLDQIKRDLCTKAKQASRLPDSHKAKVHSEIDDLLYDLELATPDEVTC